MKKTYDIHCKHCNTNTTIDWDTEKRGVALYCPCCGTKVIICDDCPIKDKCTFHPLTDTCSRMGKVHHTEEEPRRVIVEFRVDDAFAKAIDGHGTIDYVESELEVLEGDGITLENARILDDDAPEDANAISMVNAIFDHNENL